MAKVNDQLLTVIDEEGDTILVLKKPLEKLKDWPESPVDSIRAAASDSEDGSDIERGDVETAGGDHLESTPEFHFQVSSTQLKNASKYFRNMFASGFSETVPDPDDGRYHITAENFNPKAFEVVMNIIHVKTSRLPKRVDLELLAHIAILIDYYDMKDAVSFHAEIWAKAVARKKFPTTYCRDLVLRTFVAGTFGDKKNFKRGADVIVKESDGPIPDLGLPMFGLAGEI